MSERSQDPTSQSNVANTRAGRRLEYFTLGWNLTEAAVAISAGAIAGSIALVGFGADSLIEACPAGFCSGVYRRTQIKGVSNSR